MFFANIFINEDIPTITSFDKGKMIILSEQYFSDWLNLSVSGPRVFSGNKIMTIMPSLTKKVQLATVFGDEYTNCKYFPPHNCLSKGSHILHNMLTQMIILGIRQRSEMMHVDLFMISCILKRGKINLPYIVIKRLIKVWSDKANTLVYSNFFFIELFKRQKIKLSDETKMITI